jgi:hypothetical protein
MSGRTCVYCGRGANLKNEHVFPDCFSKTYDSITTAKTPSGEKAVLSDLTIHDVCGECNNGPLSQLDDYLCRWNERYFSTIVHAGDRIRFEYDLDLLLRGLLKIGYNVARARKWPVKDWRDTAQYILGKTPRPPGFRVFLQLMIPTPLKDTDLTFSPGVTEVPPLPMRVYLVDASGLPGITLGYSISVWSYRFFVLLEDTQILRSIRRRTIVKWLKHTKGAHELDSRGLARMFASSVKVLDDAETSPIFREQLTLVRQLKSSVESKGLHPRTR